MSRDPLRQDSLIIRESHFDTLRPTATASRLHRVLSEDFGPIMATATLRRASEQSGVAIDALGDTDLAAVVPFVVSALRPYRDPATLAELERDLLSAG
jgi:hypothetical protein